MREQQRIGLGGGCHWCTEGVFVSLAGVDRVDQGWIASVAPDTSYSEAVIVYYDPDRISLRELLAVHLETHAASSSHALRKRYRSAVYTFSEEQDRQCRHLLAELARAYSSGIITRVLSYGAFRQSLPEHQDYYRSDPERPFCRRYISPKLERLRADRPYLF
ncbi:peptide-methionine (S)-S-oxide reductase [Neolewinella litorea]|uniref:peptide-methionine (S)-S-oxide reductase n=1 Tax=Neolewinella litorea TaxID=2562452 RepID=A0A4S4NIQ2_9BACT|nr:peptide-methionine (S)-S-oxide reductase [Neolewinella litorea]THH39646.1 peptide methionine sulfoxide reductase [Neolewinella litorea]